MTIRIYSPEGAVGVPTIAPAPAPAVLAGRRLVVLDNGKPGAGSMLDRIGERIAARAAVEYVGVRRKRTAATPCDDDLLRELTEGADLALTGTAD